MWVDCDSLQLSSRQPLRDCVLFQLSLCHLEPVTSMLGAEGEEQTKGSCKKPGMVDIISAPFTGWNSVPWPQGELPGRLGNVVPGAHSTASAVSPPSAASRPWPWSQSSSCPTWTSGLMRPLLAVPFLLASSPHHSGICRPSPQVTPRPASHVSGAGLPCPAPCQE